MTDDLFRSTVETLAKEAALKHYQRRNHGCTNEAAWEFAVNNWRSFLDVAADILALWESLDQAEVAPWN